METLFVLFIVCLVIGGLATLILKASDEHDSAKADKIKEEFVNELKSVCEDNEIEFVYPKIWRDRITTSNGATLAYKDEYLNKVVIDTVGEKGRYALYWVDSNKKNICFVYPGFCFKLPIEDIEMYTLDGNIQYVSRIENNGKGVSVGGAIAGDIIAGPAGMIIGAIKDRNKYESKTETYDSRKVYIYYKDKNGKSQLCTISKVEPMVDDYDIGFEFADFIKETVPTKSDTYIISHSSNNYKSSKANVEEDLEKIKKLFEKNLISQEEYEKKKQELLERI